MKVIVAVSFPTAVLVSTLPAVLVMLRVSPVAGLATAPLGAAGKRGGEGDGAEAGQRGSRFSAVRCLHDPLTGSSAEAGSGRWDQGDGEVLAGGVVAYRDGACGGADVLAGDADLIARGHGKVGDVGLVDVAGRPCDGGRVPLEPGDVGRLSRGVDALLNAGLKDVVGVKESVESYPG